MLVWKETNRLDCEVCVFTDADVLSSDEVSSPIFAYERKRTQVSVRNASSEFFVATEFSVGRTRLPPRSNVLYGRVSPSLLLRAAAAILLVIVNEPVAMLDNAENWPEILQGQRTLQRIMIGLLC